MNSPIDPLTDIERRLENRTVAGPSAALTSRIRDDIAAALRSPRGSAMPTSWLSFAAGLAAVLVIGTSLSQIAVSDTRGTANERSDPARTLATARAIRELAPELSESEAMRMSIVDDVASGFVCIPQPRMSDVNSARLMIEPNGEKP